MTPMEEVARIKAVTELWKEGREKFNEASDILAGGGGNYYFDKIEGYVDALFNRFAPFKQGDRVKIIKAPVTKGNWASCKHFLKKGSKGTVHSVDYCAGQFRADVVFDDESWIDSKGEKHKPSEKHTFYMQEKEIKRCL